MRLVVLLKSRLERQSWPRRLSSNIRPSGGKLEGFTVTTAKDVTVVDQAASSVPLHRRVLPPSSDRR
jgi:hypothetical protein